MPGKSYIGTSGWNYKSWRDGFYGDTPQKQWLRFCAERFTGIEVNGTFYKLPEKSTFKNWQDQTPEDFPFAIKGHRYVTHNKKLIDVEEPVIRCRDAASPLGKDLAAVVWQLPASLKKKQRAAQAVRKNFEALEKHAARDRVSPQILVRPRNSRMPQEPRGRHLHVRRARLADVGRSDDRSRLHSAARSYPEICFQLQQAHAQKMGGAHPALAKREPCRACLFRQ